MLRDYLHLHFLIFIWGFTAVLGVLISIPAIEVVFLRTFIASVGLALVLLYQRQNFNIGMKNALKMILTGFLIGMHWMFFFASSEVSNASVTLAGAATCAFWTSILDPIISKRAVKPFEVILGLFVIGGLYIIFLFEFNHAIGLGMAVMAAILAALFTIINSKLAKKHHPTMITFYEISGACLSTILFSPIYVKNFAANGELNFNMDTNDIAYILILALICTVYAYTASVELMKRISPFAMNLSVNLEPVYGIMLAYWIIGDSEKMNGGFYIGTLVILFSVLSYPILNYYQKKRTKKLNLEEANIR
ncbi:DMT family transporter [Aureibacter tunicatorum]|uniref:Drug/metabolite transporter (DMT)-like permease n=1 Tax=Aureibacter tunicatorum TaxID=866807 RepID=A0AAE3XLE3_9BACT|nr:DMT family transporter [Aureibacter tunicatorum]MDR6237094.1 drug/metabolite transporter (DMT)-like permease [Aureibacter tunicatorum]BDD06086.1 permease [Aureibacter tunicatorum]